MTSNDAPVLNDDKYTLGKTELTKNNPLTDFEGYLKELGKTPKIIKIQKYDNQYEFVNQEVELRRKELKKIILNYCKLHMISFDEVLDVVSEVEKEYKHTSILLNKFEGE